MRLVDQSVQWVARAWDSGPGAALARAGLFGPKDPVERLGRQIDAALDKELGKRPDAVNGTTAEPVNGAVNGHSNGVAAHFAIPKALNGRNGSRARLPDSTAARADPSPDIAGAPDSLVVGGLRKSYRGRTVVSDAGLTLRRGEAVGLLGPNGAGKTTIFYMITGLVLPDAGTILLDDQDITHLPMYQRARLGIGYLPQEASIFRGMTVGENIMAVLELVEPNAKARRDELDALLEEFSISKLRDTPSIALSGGERRRCEIARALASRPAYMLLDEPFAGVDPIAVGDIRTLVRHLTTRGIGVLITDHNVRETLNLIDRATIIHSGRVLTEGTPQSIVADPEARRLYLGEGFTL